MPTDIIPAPGMKPKRAGDDYQVPEGEKFCHKMFTPTTQVAATGIDPKTGQMMGEQRAAMTYFLCVKEKCALWNEKRAKCSDAAQVDSLEEIKESLQALGVLHTGGGAS